jgi:hypothetical protein
MVPTSQSSSATCPDPSTVAIQPIHILTLLTFMLKMGTANSSEMLVITYKTTQSHNPEYYNLKSDVFMFPVEKLLTLCTSSPLPKYVYTFCMKLISL